VGYEPSRRPWGSPQPLGALTPRGLHDTGRRRGTVGASDSGGASSLSGQFLAQIEPVLPGITAKFNGKATVDWPAVPWVKGSYSYWKVGQFTQFAGVERELEGRCHFAGEHTSVDFQGYLNGAVDRGQRAAELLSA
jgi:monoamine oxidase